MNSDRKLRTRLLTAVPIAALALSLAACGGSAAERPSTSELSEGITTILEDTGGYTIGDGEDAQITTAQVDCISDELIASDIPDQDLANLAEGKDEQTSQETFELVQTTMTAAVQTCVVPAE